MAEWITRFTEVEKKEKMLELKSEELAREHKEMDEKAKEWERTSKLFLVTQVVAPIRLNIGGTTFTTTITTLLSKPGSYLSEMFSGRWEVKKSNDGTVFIDRDPFVFRHILNYLRGDVVPLAHLTPLELHSLLADAKFYKLEELENQIQKIVNSFRA